MTCRIYQHAGTCETHIREEPELYTTIADNKKFIPIVFDDSNKQIPLSLQAFTYYCYPDAYEELLRRLTEQPEILVPEIGNVPSLPLKEHQSSPIEVRSIGAVESLIDPKFKEDYLYDINSSAHLADVREIWKNKKLCIVAGAGVSISSGLPSWNGMLQSLLEKFVNKTYTFEDQSKVQKLAAQFGSTLQEQSPLVYAQFIRSQFRKDEFTELVHEALYENKKPTPNHVCSSIARLGNNLNSILTFNYDDLLEQALESEGFECTPVYKAETWASVTGIPVYHPHGYLPFERDPDENYPVVLAEEDYHTQYYSPHLWSNVAISKTLLENCCLFVGTSLADPNVRRLLDASHREQPNKKHYILTHSPLINDDQDESIQTQAVIEVFAASYQQFGVIPIWFNDYINVVPIIDSIKDLTKNKG